ncbi:MAG: hypothetical protein HQ558_03585 [Candidatus Omnitrophica bacterium]|nr:hypothetical protein [Candidatus Omnitrophota bacterium]
MNGNITEQKEAWYFKTQWLIIAFLCIGPLALPLLWFNPRFSRRNKTIVTIVVIVLSFYMTIITIRSLKAIGSYYQQIFQA